MSTPASPFDLIDLTTSPIPNVVQFSGSGGVSPTLTGTGMIIAVNARETTGAAMAQFRLRDGDATTGEILLAGAMAASGSFNFGPGYPGIPFARGVTLQSLSGNFDGTITYVPLWQYPR